MELEVAPDLALYDLEGPVGENPYLSGEFDGVQDHELTLSARALVSLPKLAPNSTEEAAAFLRAANAGPAKWLALCLQLQRMARGLPAVYPSALAAALATPEEDRVYSVADLRRGMVAYSDDPNDGNPYGHVYFIVGRNDAGNVLVWSNDARRPGGVDIVDLSFFERYWGDHFQFGATSLNGYDFGEFEEKPKPKPGRAKLGDNFEHAMDDLRKAIKHHKEKGHDRLVAVLRRDLERMKRQLARFDGKNDE